MARTRPRSFAETGIAAGKRGERGHERAVEVLPEAVVLLAAGDLLGEVMSKLFLASVTSIEPNTVVKQIRLKSRRE